MEARKIGSLSVSLVGLGCNNFGWKVDVEATRRVVDAALDAGIHFLDTADIYGATKSEEFLGEVLAGRRDRVVLATKFGMKVDDARQGAKPAYVRQAAEDSLRRLATDHIDLYQLHQPDPETPIADTLAAMDELVQSGKVREIGCSNFSAAQLREAEAAVKAGAARFVSVQNQYSLVHREPENPANAVLAECERQKLAFLPFFPLASGLLTGKYRKGEPGPEGARLSGDPKRASRFRSERNEEIAEQLRQFAESRGHTLLELAFSWLASHPAVASVIAGATSPEQVHANAGAIAWKLTPEDLAQIDRLAPREG
jgi:aryl-alcohol dehydrogenase-like predicted oxidoreductase